MSNAFVKVNSPKINDNFYMNSEECKTCGAKMTPLQLQMAELSVTHSYPISTFITPMLAIGSATDARNATPNQFGATLNVALDLDIEDDDTDTDVVRPRLNRNKVGLVDGPGNDPLAIISAVILLHSLIKSGQRTLIHCQAGQSRSVMIAAAYCHVAGVAPFDESLLKIMKLRKVDKYRNELYTLVRSVLNTISSVLEHSNKNINKE